MFEMSDVQRALDLVRKLHDLEGDVFDGHRFPEPYVGCDLSGHVTVHLGLESFAMIVNALEERA